MHLNCVTTGCVDYSGFTRQARCDACVQVFYIYIVMSSTALLLFLCMPFVSELPEANCNIADRMESVVGKVAGTVPLKVTYEHSEVADGTMLSKSQVSASQGVLLTRLELGKGAQNVKHRCAIRLLRDTHLLPLLNSTQHQLFPFRTRRQHMHPL